MLAEKLCALPALIVVGDRLVISADVFPLPTIESRSSADEKPEASARSRIEKLALGVPSDSAALLTARVPKSIASDVVCAGVVNDGCAWASTVVETTCAAGTPATSWLVLLKEIVPVLVPTVAVFIVRLCRFPGASAANPVTFALPVS